MKKIIALAAVILFVGGLSWFFARQNFGGSDEKRPVGELRDVRLKLKWVHQAQFAGNYIAIEKGFYAEEGLRVAVEPFTFENPTIDAVAEGRADFGITGADEVVLARAKGIPIKAIAVIYKTNPVAAYTLKKSGIVKPQDFIGKTVGLERGINIEFLYAAMMAKLGIDRSKVNEVTIGYDAKELLAGTTDVSTGYITNEPNQVVEAGYEVNTILMADYGVNMYADVLFAREDIIKTNPDLTERFVRATLRGWQYAIEHEDEAVDVTLRYATNSTRIHEASMLRASVPLIRTGNTPLGWMEPNRWEQVQKILLEQKVLANPIVITDAYTTQFLRSAQN